MTIQGPPALPEAPTSSRWSRWPIVEEVADPLGVCAHRDLDLDSRAVTRRLRSLASWIVLAAGLLSAVTPRQGLVVCYEQDGSASLELAAIGCGGCNEESPESAPAERVDQLASCPCVDVPLTPANQPQAKPKLVDRPTSVAPAPVLVAISDTTTVELAPCVRAAPRPGVALVGTVVLRV